MRRKSLVLGVVVALSALACMDVESCLGALEAESSGGESSSAQNDDEFDKCRKARAEMYQGGIDEGIHMATYTYEYENGNKVRQNVFHDPGAVGEPDSIIEWEYDDEGRKVREEAYHGAEASGVMESATLYEYEGDRLKKAFIHQRGRTESDPDVVVTYFYDDDGRKERAEMDGQPPISEPDGSPNGEKNWTYDEEGLMVRESLQIGTNFTELKFEHECP